MARVLLGPPLAQIMGLLLCLIVITVMAAIRLQLLRCGPYVLRIIMAITRWLAAVCGPMSRRIRGPMPSSEAGAALRITGRTGLVNLLQAVLNAEREHVLVVVRLVMAVRETTRQEVHISKEK